MDIKEFMARREKSTKDFKRFFALQYNAVDAWIREYDQWYRQDSGNVEAIGKYNLVNQRVVTPTEAGEAQYDAAGNVLAVQIAVLLNDEQKKAYAMCQEGVFTVKDNVVSFNPSSEPPFAISVDRCFSIFVEMIEAYENLRKDCME